MRFTQDAASTRNVIRGYGPGELRINDEVFRAPLILGASEIQPGPTVTDASELTTEHSAPLLALAPELVLVGTGARQVFPPAQFSAPLLRAGVGVEVMDTGAACRTFNVLASEHRRVVALLLP